MSAAVLARWVNGNLSWSIMSILWVDAPPYSWWTREKFCGVWPAEVLAHSQNGFSMKQNHSNPIGFESIIDEINLSHSAPIPPR